MINLNNCYLLLLLVSFAAGAQGEDLYGHSTARAISRPLTPFGSATRETRILWDTSHGVFLDNDLNGSFSDLVVLLALKNQYLEQSDKGVLNLNLQTYDALVVNLSSNHNAPYTIAEVEAIVEFVAKGGNLLINSDNAATPLGNIDELGAAFGVSFSRDVLLPTDMVCTDFSDWSLFEGVETVFFDFAGEISPQLPLESGARAPTGETIVAAGRYGAGNVLVVGDTNYCENNYLGDDDNQRFTENLFDALSVITVPTLSTGPLVLLVVLLMAGGLVFLRRIRSNQLV